VKAEPEKPRGRVGGAWASHHRSGLRSIRPLGDWAMGDFRGRESLWSLPGMGVRVRPGDTGTSPQWAAVGGGKGEEIEAG
jgi:hypothetical protein